MIEIRNTADLSFKPTLNMLVYGEPGTGKTVFGATAPRPLIVDAEAGVLSIREKGVDVMAVRNFNDLRELLAWVKIPENNAKYDTIVLDSITEVMKKVVDEVRGNKERPTMQDWGTIISKTEGLLRMLRDLDKNIIVTALVSEEKDDNRIVKRPAVNGNSLPELMCSFMDIVGYMDVEKVAEGSERRIWTQPHLNYYAKDRSGKLANPIVAPDFTQILVDVFGEAALAYKGEAPQEEAPAEPAAPAEATGEQSPKAEPEKPLTPAEMAANKAKGLNSDGSTPENSASTSETAAPTGSEDTSQPQLT